MAKSLRSKRARKNRAIQAEKKAPRILKKMKDSMAAAKEFNEMRDAEKAKTVGVEMENVEEKALEGDQVMADGNRPKLDLKSGLNEDGSRPVWMSPKNFKKTKSKLRQQDKKWKPNKFGIGPHKKVNRKKVVGTKK